MRTRSARLQPMGQRNTVAGCPNRHRNGQCKGGNRHETDRIRRQVRSPQTRKSIANRAWNGDQNAHPGRGGYRPVDRHIVQGQNKVGHRAATNAHQRGHQPNTRTICKAMSDAWGEKVAQSDVYALFPLDPSKQGGKVAGLPESRRKGGY